MEPLHDVNGAARILAVSPWTVRAYIRKGKLRPIRIGRLVRLEEKELTQFVASARTGSAPEQTQLEDKGEQI
jgi:excisionase family DNA binding protein